MRLRVAVSAMLAFIWLGSPLATYAGEQRMGLLEAIRMAFEGNFEMRARRNALSAQQEEVGVARGSLLPKIGFEERALRTNNPTLVFSSKLNQGGFSATDLAVNSLNSPNPTTDFQTLFTFEQPIFIGKAYVGLAMAKKELSAQQADYQRKKEELALRVIHNYLQVLTAREILGVVRQGVEDTREHRRIAEVRFENGLGLYSDTLRSKTTVIEAEQRVVTAEKNYTLAKRSLGLLVGREDPVDIAQDRFEFVLQDPGYYTGASLSRSDLQALQLRWENAKNGIRLAESQYLPTLSLGGTYQLNDPSRILGSEGESWQVMALLRWELFDGSRREFERKKAYYQASETGEALNGLKQLVSFKISEAYLAVEESRKNAELSKAALQTAEEGWRLVKRRFENSLSPLIDLLDVQLNLDQARANVVMKENEYRLAIVRVGYESGTLLADLNLNP